MPDIIDNNEPKALPLPERKWRIPRAAIGATALAAALVAGAAFGAAGTRMMQRWTPQRVMLLQPSQIDKMAPASVVAVKGEVADVFGNKFVLQDASGRALVDTGPRGDRGPVAMKGEPLTVQGRFDRGVIHAQVVMHADGRADAFGPPGPPPEHGPKGGPKEGPKGPGPRADRGPAPPLDEAAPPPPPPGR